jgi:hypothetical protein
MLEPGDALPVPPGTFVLFGGPTVHDLALNVLLPAFRVHPPARCGDVLRAAAAGARVIAIVDGYFEHQLAVWHKEILWALSRGVHVFGASSMGALRAAELDAFGMVGLGLIYAWYREGEIEDDDEVAMVHQPAAAGYAPLSEAMVNIRATLSCAQEEGVLDARTHDLLLGMAKQTFYPERSFPALVRRGREAGVDLSAFTRWLSLGNRRDQKRADTLLLIERLREAALLASEPFRAQFSFQYTELFHELIRRELPSLLHAAP